MSDEPSGALPDPIGGDEAPPPTPDPDATPPCAECGAPLQPGQAYCLNCGAPTPAAPRPGGNQRATGLLAAGLIIAGLGAGAIGFAVATDGEDGASVTTSAATNGDGTTVLAPPAVTEPTPTVITSTLPGVTTAPSVTTPPATTAPSTTGGIPEVTLPSTSGGLPPATTIGPTATTATTTVTTTRTVTRSEGSAARSTDDWPDGRTGWTAIVKSTPVRAEALAVEGRLAQTGRNAGVLRSDDYSSLKDGYFVVFSGTYGTRDQAAMQARALQGTFPTAYARAIVP